METLTVGSLFSGIGGLDLGLERAGMNVIWQSEIDPYCSRVLKKHWPEVPNYGDIKEIKWHEIERPDVICGGYPCQPFSTAGKRRGSEDSRHLWPWVQYGISQLRPRYAILENVRGHLSMGGTDVLGDLASIGYDAEWRVISAASVGANHRRDRVFIVAYPFAERLETPRAELEAPRFIGDCENKGQLVANAKSEFGNVGGHRKHSNETGEWGNLQIETRTSSLDVADTDTRKTSWGVGGVSEDSRLVFGRDNIGRGTQSYAGWQWWETEPNVGRVANGISNRVDRLRGLGNAVVPQVAETIGRLVMEASCHR
jgi:DNA (cytosine-5)-methyltransferase 1